MKAILGRKYRAKFGDGRYITKGGVYIAIKNMFYNSGHEEIFCFTNDRGTPDCATLSDMNWEEVKLTPLNELIYEIEQDVTAI